MHIFGECDSGFISLKLRYEVKVAVAGSSGTKLVMDF